MRRLALVMLLTLSLPLASAEAQAPHSRMPSFSSFGELNSFLRNVIRERERRMRAMRRSASAAPSALGAAQGAEANDAITNNQTAGVDEGGIVKLQGNYFVVLRRGRLFTIDISRGDLIPVDMADAFGPGIDPSGAWYDEMLVGNGLVVVIGYSYARGGTEVGIFRLGEQGTLRHVDTYHLRSNDYYSSRNYAARLIGTKLVFYTPLHLPWGLDQATDILPAMRRWTGREDGRAAFRPIVRPQRVFRPENWSANDEMALHTVTSCELNAPQVSCEATVLIGPPGNVFYVSGSAVYVWMTSWNYYGGGDGTPSMLARIPLDGGDPTAARVAGSPVDQFSFLDSEDGFINVMVRANGRGGWMWSGERSEGNAALLRLPLSDLGDGSRSAPAGRYRRIPTPPGYTFQNRFVGDYLLYGSGNGWGNQRMTDSTLVLVPWRGGEMISLTLRHGTDRIEVMGNDAVVVGVRGPNLEFSGINLQGRPSIRQRFIMPDAAQGELRSHGFFYRNDGDDLGVLGLPVRSANSPGYRHLVEGSASILFLRNTDGAFARMGQLASGALSNANDNCRASCVDWYGNARPIFARGRVFALMGYELVEGALNDGRITERRRLDFAPRRPLATR